MDEQEDKLRYAMEDEACKQFLYLGQDLYLASIAVSMKRIADAICGNEKSCGIHEAIFDIANRPI